MTDGRYDMYPVFPLRRGEVFTGFESLWERISGKRTVIIDGYQGVFFEDLREQVDRMALRDSIRVKWMNVATLQWPGSRIDEMISPFLGGDDPLFGKRTTLELSDFFDPDSLSAIRPDPMAPMNILYGTGSSLAGWEGCLVYIDLPRNEVQYRARARSITNLGAESPHPPKEMYKRSYFVDWVVLNRHKKEIAGKVDMMVDGQRPDEPSWMDGQAFRNALDEMAGNAFRVRPWFEPGPWGGNWMKETIPGLNAEVQNYAWSFEMIAPENGVILEKDGRMLEISFDWLMSLEGEKVLGDCYPRFRDEFPIRFDFLDTFDGGNLSVQCHPRADYMLKQFGENFTQQEAYYILDTKENAMVNLGFSGDIDPAKFRKALEESAENNTEVNIPDYVLQHPATKHDLFLIPEGTIHGSGANNLVLEISTTPYIFTFKMYDWLRMDLNGKPRDLNIARAFENLDFTRKGDAARTELISCPELLGEAAGWKKFHLPTHPVHLYDVHRYHIRSSVQIFTENKCHVLNLVQGERILVETVNNRKMFFGYAETFVIPAAANSYTITNLSGDEAMVVLAFIKDDAIQESNDAW
jgi:mannose-6-phosphate isomerase class I